ncbi:unnamed protein product, partial [marine sediment metagenome]
YKMIGIFKVGSRWHDKNSARHLLSWNTYDPVEFRADTAHITDRERTSFVVLRFTGDYDKEDLNLKRYLVGSDGRRRDYFLDFELLGLPPTILDDVYNKDKAVDIVDLHVSLDNLIRNKESHVYARSDKLLLRGSIESGTHQIGTGGGADYATIITFEADIGATQDGNLKGEHQDEETACGALVTFEHDSNGHDCIFTAEAGAEHTAAVYGNGARINMGTSGDYIRIDTKKFEFSIIAIDAAGTNNRGVQVVATAGSTSRLINRCLIKGDSN